MAERTGWAVLACAVAVTASGCASEPGAVATSASPLRAARPELDSVTLTMVPSVGEHSFEWGLGRPDPVLAPPLSWTVDFTAPEDVAELWIRVRLLREGGVACLSSASRVGRVARGNRYLASGDSFQMPALEQPFRSLCSDIFATDTVDVNLVDGAGAEDDVLRGYSFVHYYYFVRTGTEAGAGGS